MDIILYGCGNCFALKKDFGFLLNSSTSDLELGIWLYAQACVSSICILAFTNVFFNSVSGCNTTCLHDPVLNLRTWMLL